MVNPTRRLRLTPVKASQPSARSRALAYASTITPPRPVLASSRASDRSQVPCIGWQYLDEQARFKLRLAGLYVGDDDAESAAI
ncbi:hypothetical protein PINS_up000613 [Pythium insidiosum]|nr:hypothetical protein PINS_up000613 [Pythium insidiosum]